MLESLSGCMPVLGKITNRSLVIALLIGTASAHASADDGTRARPALAYSCTHKIPLGFPGNYLTLTIQGRAALKHCITSAGEDFFVTDVENDCSGYSVPVGSFPDGVEARIAAKLVINSDPSVPVGICSLRTEVRPVDANIQIANLSQSECSLTLPRASSVRLNGAARTSTNNDLNCRISVVP